MYILCRYVYNNNNNNKDNHKYNIFKYSKLNNFVKFLF